MRGLDCRRDAKPIMASGLNFERLTDVGVLLKHDLKLPTKFDAEVIVIEDGLDKSLRLAPCFEGL